MVSHFVRSRKWRRERGPEKRTLDDPAYIHTYIDSRCEFPTAICPQKASDLFRSILLTTPVLRLPDQRARCEALVAKIKTVSDLPAVCKNYDSVKAILQKRKTVTDPFAGMKGATQARANRSKGHEHHAKIQRRATSGGTTGAERFSKLEK